MLRLRIDEMVFLMAFGRDVGFHDAYPQSTYLDRETGEVIWAYDNDDDSNEIGRKPEENHEIRMIVAANPDRYLGIQGLSHGEHHDILQEFLDSDWTAKEEDRRLARSAYFGSIGAWRKSAEDSADIAYEVYREQKISERAEAFLKSHGVEPVWR